jgi:hypothetical protein
MALCVAGKGGLVSDRLLAQAGEYENVTLFLL